LWELVKASREPTVSARLDQITQPALVVTGTMDTIVPPDASRQLASELPNATLAELSDCGHVPQEECAARLLDAIGTWWSANLTAQP
jgi:Predicted hydrolases or acyltransferases (alpha/beta hydrolase superfamily)